MTPRIRVRFLMALCSCVTVFASMGLAGCGGDVVRETGVHRDGAPAWVREYVITPQARKVAHGTHATWYADGARRTLEFYEHGVRQGYAFEWDESGALARLQACEGGVCEARAVRVRPAPAGATLAAVRE